MLLEYNILQDTIKTYQLKNININNEYTLLQKNIHPEKI